MDPRYWRLKGWPGDLCALVAGALLPLALAPFDWWPLGILSAGALAWLLRGRSPARGFWRSFLFGLGVYGIGASWVYVSIHQFGLAPPWLAATLTAAFVAGMALVFGLPFYLYCRFFAPSRAGYLIVFPAVWVLGEWLRSWLLTGFPWLFLGYGYLDTWLAGWAPVLGVFSVSYGAVFTAVALSYLAYDLLRARWQPPAYKPRPFSSGSTLLILLSLWLGGLGLQHVRWTQEHGEPISVGMVQANIPQELKWQPFYLTETLAIFRELSNQVWDKDWVIWPEAAMPMMYHEAEVFLEEFHERALATDTTFISGILYDERETGRYYNTIIGLGLGDGMYHKQRLVPFGEYVPLQQWLRGLIHFFDLPTSIIAPGPAGQEGLEANGLGVSPYICYEIVYPDLVAENGWNSNVLITISNDAWFGKSIGPLQHFQMARMRALENGRYLIRATNNGVSGIIDHLGRTQVSGGRFTREVITGEARPMSGHTPFAHWLSTPMVLMAFMSVAGVAIMQHRRRRARQLVQRAGARKAEGECAP